MNTYKCTIKRIIHFTLSKKKEIYVIVDKSAYFAKNNFFVCVFDFRFLFLPNIAQNGIKINKNNSLNVILCG